MENKKLDKLMNRLNGMDEELLRGIDLTSLPIFGHKNREVQNTREVWSWDDDRIMIDSGNRFKLVDRCIVCGEADFHCKHD